MRQVSGWRINNKPRSIPRNKKLRIKLLSPALVHWSLDGWKTSVDTNTRDTGLGIHTARPADGFVAWRKPGRIHILLAAGESLGRQGLHRNCGVGKAAPDVCCGADLSIKRPCTFRPYAGASTPAVE